MQARGSGNDQRCRVLVIGGGGHFGTRVVAALRANDRFEVLCGGRGAGNDVRVDLTDPSQLSAFDEFDAIVNCSDGLVADPSAAACRCIERGSLFIETSANPEVVDRLLAPEVAAVPGDGLAVVSMGLFPGVSNLMLKTAYERWPADELSMGVRLSVLSGAGRGMCSLMVGLLGTEQGVSRGRPLPHGDRLRTGVVVPFPEQQMLARQGVRLASTQLATIPAAMGASVLVLGWLLGAMGPLKRLARSSLAQLFYLARGLVFGSRPTFVELLACAARDPSKSLRFSSDDGLLSGGFAVAAGLEVLLERRRRPRSVHTPEELFEWRDIATRMQRLGDRGRYADGAPRRSSVPLGSARPSDVGAA